MAYQYGIKQLLNGARKLLGLANNQLNGQNSDVNIAFTKVDNALIGLEESELPPAFLDYKLTLESLLENDDDNIRHHPNLDDY